MIISIKDSALIFLPYLLNFGWCDSLLPKAKTSLQQGFSKRCPWHVHRIHLRCVGISCTEEYVAPLIPTSKMSVVFLVIVRSKYPLGMIVPQIYNYYSITLGFPQFTKWVGYLFCLKLQNPWQFAQASTSQGLTTYFCKSNCSGNKSCSLVKYCL